MHEFKEMEMGGEDIEEGRRADLNGNSHIFTTNYDNEVILAIKVLCM